MEHRNISLFRGYSDTESVETSLEEIVNIIKCDAALRDRTEKHRRIWCVRPVSRLHCTKAAAFL